MRRRPVSHYAESLQTGAEIYADQMRFPPGWEVSSTSYHQWTLGFTVAGRSHCRYDSHDRIVEAGDFVLCRPHCRLSFRVCDDQAKSHSSKAEGVYCGWDTIYAVFHPSPHW